jgi:hypothetical protein
MSRGFSNLTPAFLPTITLSIESGVSIPHIVMEEVHASHNIGIPCGPTPSFCKCFIVM